MISIILKEEQDQTLYNAFIKKKEFVSGIIHDNGSIIIALK